MATKKPAAKPAAAKPSTAVTVKPAGALSTSVSDRLKQHAARVREEVGKTPAGGTQALSFKGGRIRLGEDDLGHELPVVILATQFERTFYPNAYKDGADVVPSCFSRDGGPLAKPDDRAAYPQAKLCAGCPHDEFGSALQGEGKACREGLKIAVVHPSNCGKGKVPPLVVARFSIKNTQLIQKDLKAMYAQHQFDHPVQVVSVLTCNPHDGHMIENRLRFQGFTPTEVVEELEPLIDDAQTMLDQPYPNTKAVDPAQAGGKKPARNKKAY